MALLKSIFISLSLAFVPVLSAAESFDPPTGDVILTVTGSVANTNSEDAALLDLELLEGMDPIEFETSTIWTDGPQTFVGVPLATLVERLGLEGTTLRATAINDYAVEIPMEDAIEDGPIVAYLRNGEEMSVREKGPLWIVYPYDQNEDYQAEVIYSRSIWQLDRLESIE